MIISDDSPPSPAKSRNFPDLPSTSESALQANPPPPAYGSIPPSARHTPPSPPSPPSHASSSQAIPVWFERKPRKSVLRRFLKALAIGLLVWLLITWIFGLTRTTFGGANGLDYPIPDGVHVSQCVEGATWEGERAHSGKYPFVAHKSFDLPLSSDVMSLLARGALSAGAVQISTLPLPSDTVRVDVELQYYSSKVLEHTQVCQIKWSKGHNGVGFFTPRRWVVSRWEDRPFFNVHVYFPENTDLLTIKAFDTDLPNYSHSFFDLGGRVYFKSLSLKGSNGMISGESLSFGSGTVQTSNAMIKIDSLLADKADIRSTNGHIEGHYVSQGDLTLKTSNAQIKSTVEFGSAKSSSALSVTTDNGFVDVQITAHGSKSTIVTRTSNAQLFTHILDIPVDSTLILDAKTSNNLAQVSLPAAYEGSFAMSTSNAHTGVKDESHPEDPKGKGRSRQVTTRVNGKGTSAGNVYWDEKSKDRGKVTLSSSNGPVTLKL